jgi:hypothetical protein
MYANFTNKVLIIIVSLLAIILIFDTFALYKKSEAVSTDTPPVYNSLKYNFSNTLIHNLSKLDRVDVFYENDSIKNFNLIDSINTTTLIFRFSGKMCDQCVFFVIEKIKERFENYSSDQRIVLLASDITPRAKTFYEKRILTLMKDLDGELEEGQIPYLFIIDKDHKKQFVFVPDKSCPKLTEEYLRVLKTRFFKN